MWKKMSHTKQKKTKQTNRIVRYKAQQHVTQIGKTEKNLFKGNPFFCISIHGLLHIVYSGPCSAHFLN